MTQVNSPVQTQALYDVVIFGATGFTGGLVAEYLAQNAAPNTRWALAGRSRHRLDQVFSRLCSSSPAVPPRGILVADVDNPHSLNAMAASCRVLMSTVGPFSRYGEPVVAACVEQGTHYVDITGEPEFVSRIRRKHHAAASQKGVRLVPACGFDSLPHDLGAWFTRKLLPRDVAVDMEGFVKVRGTISGGTWQTAVEAMGTMPLWPRGARKRRNSEQERKDSESASVNASEIEFSAAERADVPAPGRSVPSASGSGSEESGRSASASERSDFRAAAPSDSSASKPSHLRASENSDSSAFKSSASQASDSDFPAPERSDPFASFEPAELDSSSANPSSSSPRKAGKLPQGIRYEEEVKAYVAPLPTLDPLIVIESARNLEEYGPRFRYAHYIALDSLFGLGKLLLGASAVFLLARNRWSRRWLLQRMNAGEGPSKERRARSSFSLTFVARSAGLRAKARVSGGDPGYDETAKMLAESGLCLAFDQKQLPDRAGVLTTAQAMGDRLVERLVAKGMRFEVLEAPSEES